MELRASTGTRSQFLVNSLPAQRCLVLAKHCVLLRWFQFQSDYKLECHRRQANTCFLCSLSAERYDPLTSTWTSIAAMSTRRRYVRVATLGTNPQQLWILRCHFTVLLRFKNKSCCYVDYFSSQMATCMLWEVTTAPRILPQWKNMTPRWRWHCLICHRLDDFEWTCD